MAPLKQPLSLCSKCLIILVRSINRCSNIAKACVVQALQTGGDWEEMMEIVRNLLLEVRDEYFTMIPAKLKKQIAPLAINTVDEVIHNSEQLAERSVVGNSRYQQISTMLMSSVMYRCLVSVDIKDLKSKFSVVAVVSCLHLVPRLEILKLPSRFDVNASLLDKIRHLPSLKHYEQPRYCDNDIIAEIGQHCRLVSRVVVNLSKDIDDICIPHLFHLEGLVNLNISETFVSKDGYLNILRELKGLKNLSWSYDFIDDILVALDASSLENKELAACNVENLQLLAEKCINITSLILYSYTVSESLDALSRLQSLELLMAVGIKFAKFNAYSTFLSIGQRLKALTFKYVSDLDICIIIRNCVCLCKLEIWHCTFTTDTLYADLDMCHFHILNRLKLTNNEGDAWYIDILNNYTELEYLEVDSKVEFDDNYFLYAFAVDGFRRLKELYVKNGLKITARVADMLTEFCEDLRFLGKFKKWEHFTEEEFRDLTRRIREMNYDLKVYFLA